MADKLLLRIVYELIQDWIVRLGYSSKYDCYYTPRDISHYAFKYVNRFLVCKIMSRTSKQTLTIEIIDNVNIKFSVRGSKSYMLGHINDPEIKNNFHQVLQKL